MKHITALFLLACIGCGSEPDIAPSLKSILDLYLQNAPTNGHFEELTKVKFGNPGTSAEGVSLVGACEVSGSKKIGGKSYFQKREIIVRDLPITPSFEAAVLHELAHCLHDLEHVEDPKALMAKKHFDNDEYWSENLVIRLREAF